MTGVIIAGGLGTRLRSVIGHSPKCLAAVNGKPFLFYLLNQLAQAGVSRIVLCTGFGANHVEAVVGREFEGIPVLYSEEPEPFGTGGALRLATDRHVCEDAWLVMNGDSFFGVDLAEFAGAAERMSCHAAIAAAHVDDGSRFGAVTWSAERVLAFEEKTGVCEPKWINAGIYYFKPAFLHSLPDRKPLSLEREVFPEWTAKGLAVYPSEGQFIDIGVPESFAEAQTVFAELAA